MSIIAIRLEGDSVGQNITTLANGVVILDSWRGEDEQSVTVWPSGNVSVITYSAESETKGGRRVPDSIVVYPPNLRENAPLKLEGVGGTTMTIG